MEQICAVLWALLSGLAVWVSRGLSWLLDNVAAFARWWEQLPSWAKVVLLAVATALLGAGAMYVGVWVLACPGWPEWMAVLFVVLTAVASWFGAGKRHEQQKRQEAEAEALELRQKVAALEYELEQLRRKRG